MSRIEELPDGFDEKLDLNKPAANQQAPDASPEDLLDKLLSQPPPFPIKSGQPQNASSTEPSAAMPPAMQSVRQYNADEMASMLNRTPLFMTSLDETDGEGGENIELEALRALAYEGTKSEVAQNFREQGNDHARAKNWRDAKGYYDQALAALKDTRARQANPEEKEDGEPEMDMTPELNAEEEAKKERGIEEACYINRALCNLELKNYRACNLDCASTLRLNPTNVKAWFRSASACLALDKIPEAEDACSRGLAMDASNAALKTLATKIHKRKVHLAEVEHKRLERQEREAAESRTLAVALQTRNIKTRKTAQPPNTEDAIIKLAEPLDPSSTLSVPVILLYPLHAQSDFIKTFEESQTLNEHLDYILPLPWDSTKEYAFDDVECYVESASGGLLKAGRKLPLLKILGSGKVEVVDGMVKVYVVPKARSTEWITEFKRRQGRAP